MGNDDIESGMEFRLRNIPEKAWEDFKILCIREKTYPNHRIIDMIKTAVAKSRPKS